MMIGVVWRSCPWCITTQQQQHKQVQPVVAQHKGNGGEEELRLVRHSITNNPSFIYRLQQYQPIYHKASGRMACCIMALSKMIR
jgi:hypothetical protein